MIKYNIMIKYNGKKKCKKKSNIINIIGLFIVIIFSILLIYIVIKSIFYIKSNLTDEINTFLKTYNIIPGIILFILAKQILILSNSLVNNILMPFIDPLLGENNTWKNQTKLGPFNFNLGQFISSLINFSFALVIMFLIYIYF